jgi:uncharacterized protein YlxW (UPF0749 family)
MGQFIIILVSFFFGIIISGLVYGIISSSKEKKLNEEIIKEKEKARTLDNEIKQIEKKAEDVKNEKMPDDIDSLLNRIKSVKRGL